MPAALMQMITFTWTGQNNRGQSKGVTGMEMQDIRYFLAMGETLDFTKAAEACRVSQPALTRGIRKLEDELGGYCSPASRTRYT